MFWRKKEKVHQVDVISAGLKYDTRNGMIFNLNKEINKLKEEINSLAAEHNSKVEELEEKLDARRKARKESDRAFNEWQKLRARYRKQKKNEQDQESNG